MVVTTSHELDAEPDEIELSNVDREHMEAAAVKIQVSRSVRVCT